MTTTTTKAGDANLKPEGAKKIRMTDAMREGLDSLQREYDAFVESSHQAIEFMTEQRTRGD